MENISKATRSNWERLNVDSSTKLTTRANKSKSKKKVIANSYLNSSVANRILEEVKDLPYGIGDVMYSLCIYLLTCKGLMCKQHVKDTLSRFCFREIPLNFTNIPPIEDDDILGFVYQSMMTEGERNSWGQYYTNKEVVRYMVQDVNLGSDQTFLDPCCGSGAYLLGVETGTPSNLYGFDLNPIAVMLASVNLLLKYSGHEFVPNIHCLDFLDDSLFSDNMVEAKSMKFDYIYTNPPWGADKTSAYSNNAISSKEKSSMFVVKAMDSLSPGGRIHFLLPTSLLKIKVHADIRKYILTKTSIKTLDLYTGRFDGVFTDYFSIRLEKGHQKMQSYKVSNHSGSFDVNISDYTKCEIGFEKVSDLDTSIIDKMETRRIDDLTHSKWALGIVTGDNKSKIHKEQTEGAEAVYTGKQIEPYRMNTETSYLVFDPSNFQQCAKEEYYRAPEKLVYRFIAKYPIVAYDDQQRLCLNSANILIPEVRGASIRSVAALLNSSLYRFYYITKFKDIKVLKGNLQALPFPELTEEQDRMLSMMVNQVIATSSPSAEQMKMLDEQVYSIFDVTDTEKSYIYQRIG